MSNPTELPDLDKLEALARAATPGPWDWGGTECDSAEQAIAICKENIDATEVFGTHFCEVYDGNDKRTALVGNGPTGIANAEFIAAANPAAVLALIALARRAQPEGEAPQAEAGFYVSYGDDSAVDLFAAAMKAKMAASRVKGRGGWNDPDECPADRLQSMLIGHLGKGDPVDVANFCMMLWNRGENTVAPAAALSPLCSAQQAAAPGALPDQSQFEAQARYQGATNFEPVHPDFMVCNNGWTPATYRDPMTELAWRVWANKRIAPSAPGTPEAPADDDLLEAVARAIWNIRREEEDRCDMELEDMGDDHPVWDEAEAAIAATQRAAQLDGGQGEAG